MRLDGRGDLPFTRIEKWVRNRLLGFHRSIKTLNFCHGVLGYHPTTNRKINTINVQTKEPQTPVTRASRNVEYVLVIVVVAPSFVVNSLGVHTINKGYRKEQRTIDCQVVSLNHREHPFLGFSEKKG